MFYRRLPRFVIRYVGVVCDVMYICLKCINIIKVLITCGPPRWSSGQSFWLEIQRFRDRFPALPDFLRSSGSGTGSTQPREYN
jgi:hypothetical protein